MTTVLPLRDDTRSPTRVDGATLACFFALAMTLIPARLIFAKLPLALTPAMLIGLLMGVVWFCAQMLDNAGAAKGRSAVRTAFFLFALSQVATYGYATYSYLPQDELKATDRTFITLMAFVCVGLAVCDGVRGLVRIDRVLKVLVGGSTFMAVVGILQFALGFDLTKYLMLPGLQLAGDISFVLERSNFRRPAGTAEHPIEFGVVCAMAVPLALHYAFRAKDYGGPQLRWWLSLGLLAVAAMQSLSRSAVLGLFVAGLVLIPHMRKGRRIRAVIACAFFLVALRGLVPGLVGTLIALFTNIAIDPSTGSRTRAIDRAGEELAQHLWLGRGMGTYLPTKYGYLDNQYLGTMVMAGMIGLAALIFLFLASGYAAMRARLLSDHPQTRELGITLAACLTIPAISAATFDLLAFSVASGFAFLLMGCSGALLRAAKEERATRLEGVRP